MRKQKVENLDFNVLFKQMKEKINSVTKYRENPMIQHLLLEFERLKKVSDTLYDDIQSRGIVEPDGRGKTIANPSIALHNKNNTSLLKCYETLQPIVENITNEEEAEW